MLVYQKVNENICRNICKIGCHQVIPVAISLRLLWFLIDLFNLLSASCKKASCPPQANYLFNRNSKKHTSLDMGNGLHAQSHWQVKGVEGCLVLHYEFPSAVCEVFECDVLAPRRAE